MRTRSETPLDARILAWLLALYPRRFRVDFGAEMLAVYLERRRGAGGEPGSTSFGRWVALQWIAALGELPGVWADELRRPVFERQRKGESVISNLAYESRLAARSLLTRQRSFTVLCVLTLALGLGATTAIFSVVHGVLLAPLPYGEPDRIVRLGEGRWSFMPGPVFNEVRSRMESLEVVAAFYDYRPEGIDRTDTEEPERLEILRIGNGFFEALGVRPLIGREFSLEEEIPPGAAQRDPEDFVMTTEAAHRVVVLSHKYWKQRLGSDPDVIGKRLELDQNMYSVIGVMPAGLGGHVGGSPDLWLPLDLAPGGVNTAGNYYLSAVGRLAQGATLEQARAELERVTALLRAEPEVDENLTLSLEPLEEVVVGASRSLLGLLFAAVAAMLAIACINVANLFLARGLARQRELGLRAALGANAGRLFAQTLIESLWVALAGGALGVALAWGAVQLLLDLRPDALPRYDALGLHLPVLAFSGLAVILTVFCFGLAPAFRAAWVDGRQAFGERSPVGHQGRGGRQLRDATVCLQVALALVLLMAGSLLARSFFTLHQTDMGFEPDQVLTYQLRLPDYGYAEPESRVAFYDRLFERLESSPMVAASGATSKLPGNGHRNHWGFGIEGYERVEGAPNPNGEIRCVAGRALDALSVELLRGRPLSSRDRADQEAVVLVNQALVDRFFQGRDPLGVRLSLGWPKQRTVVGVVANTRHDPREEAVPKVYVPQAQFADDRNWDLSFVVTREGETSWDSVRALVESTVAELDPRLAVYGFRTMAEVAAEPIARQRFGAQLMLAFAGLSLLLAAVGLFGALAYSLDQRRAELGVRMALGADRRGVLLSVLWHGLRICGLGVAFGLVGVWAVERWIESLIHGVASRDPLAFALAAGVLLLAGGVASFEPARRASRLDPAKILRDS